MATREFGIEKKSLISNLTLKIESPVFKNCISLQCFQQEVLEFDTITSIKPEETSKKAAKHIKTAILLGFILTTRCLI